MGKKKGVEGEETKLAPKPKPKETSKPKEAPKQVTKQVIPKDEGFGKHSKDDDVGFETVVGKSKVKEAKKQAAAAQQAQSDLVTREYPLNKDQVRIAISKKAQIEEESNVRMTHKEAPFPGNPSTMVLVGTSMSVMRAEQLLCKALKEVKHEEAIPTSKRGDPMVGVIIGPKGQNMEKFREIAPAAKVQLPEEGGRTVAIYGQPSDVQRIAAAIRQLSGANVDASQVELFQEEVEMVRKVPRDRSGKPMHWVLIGKSGCNIRRIREETGAELMVPPPHSPSDEYTLRGSMEACERASRIIYELLLDLGDDFDSMNVEAIQAKQEVAARPVPRDPLVVPSTTGARTCVAPRLQRKVQEAYAPPRPPAPVAAVSAATAAAPAKAMEPIELGTPTLLDIPLPASAGSAKLKQRIKELAAENNVKVAFDGNNSLRLDGFHRRCLYAERAILRCLGLTKAEVPIPRSRQGDPMVGLVIGPQGGTIKDIRLRSGDAFVLLPDDGCGLAYDCVTIFGTAADVDRAVDVVRYTLQITEEATRRPASVVDPSVMEVELEIPRDRQGNALLSVLIGASGKNIKWIREESDGVEIDVPKKREYGVTMKCKLRGTKQQIEAAQSCIKILFDDCDEQFYTGEQGTGPTLPKNPFANCTIIGGR